MTTKLTTYPTEPTTPIHLERIAAAVNSHREGEDAAVLATAISRAVHGDLILVSIEPELPLVLPGADLRRIEATTAGLSVPVTATVDRDAPAASLLDLSAVTDLLVIGSRRWGPLARLLLGGTGEALVHGAQCSLLIVPRPATES